MITSRFNTFMRPFYSLNLSLNFSKFYTNWQQPRCNVRLPERGILPQNIHIRYISNKNHSAIDSRSINS